jgi:EpsD family peptidyl-prolyl cis-trans isomerase
MQPSSLIGPLTKLTRAVPRAALLAVACGAAVMVSACGGGKDKPAGQAVARVNQDEITVHQINHLLGQQRGIKPDQVDAASRRILERLIDQELALQKAQEQKLDRDARVVAQLEAARREILARAYLDRVGDAASKPSAEDIRKYYTEHPALFAQRRIFQLQEINIEAKAEQLPQLRQALESAKNPAEFVNYLRDQSFKFSGSQAVRGAEQIPLNALPRLAALKDGQALFNEVPTGANVVVLVGSRAQPVDEAAARPVIEQFLVNDARRRLVADDMKAMRAAAKIEYLGKFASGPKPAVASGTDAEEAASAAVAPAASAALDAGSISKGLGLK